MDAFPAFYPLAGRKVVIAGTGEAAQARLRLFEGAPCEIVRLEGAAALESAAYGGAILAFIGDEDEDFCREAAFAARKAGVPVNVTDRPALCDFTTPAVIDRGSVVAAVGTGGAAPMLASILRGDIEAQVPEGAGRVAALLHQMKDEVRETFPEMTARRAFLRAAIHGPAAQAAADGDMNAAASLLRNALSGAGAARPGAIWLVDGRGPVDLLSLRALRALGEADAALVDEAADAGIKARIRRDAPRLGATPVGQIIARALNGERIAVVSAAAPEPALVAAARSAGVAAEILPVAGA